MPFGNKLLRALADQQNRIRAAASYKSLSVLPETAGSGKAGSCGDQQDQSWRAAAHRSREWHGVTGLGERSRIL